jgi:hypothetical protein
VVVLDVNHICKGDRNMLRKLFFAAAVLGGLTLSPAVESRADVLATPSKPDAPPCIVTLEGKLIAYDFLSPQIPEYEPWTAPSLEVGSAWYGLDFSENKALNDRVASLYGKTVKVTGRIEKRRLGGMIPHTINVLVVSKLKPVKEPGSVKKTVQVEMKGQFLFRADHLDILRPDSRLIVNGKTYVVEYGTNSDLWHAAVPLDGHTAVVTGTLDGNTITATAVKGVPDQVSAKVSVAIEGKLQFVIKHFFTGEVLFTCDKLPECLSRSWSIGYGVTVDGRLYQFDLGNDGKLREQAEKLIGHSVLAEGTLKKDVVLVTSLKELS